ncbi:MAG: glutathione S-transferase family protein [Pseudomonadota bacterium]
MSLVLYGRNMSPFARRLAVICALQGRAVERKKILVQGEDFETLKGVNPVGRVPALVLEDGETLIETFAIFDWLEETAPEGLSMLPPSGAPRRAMLQALAYANAVAEKGVALVYDKNRRPAEKHWPEWIARLEGQIAGGLQATEALAPAEGWLGGDRPMVADIAFVVAWDFVSATNPHLLAPGYPKLEALAGRAAALPAFAQSLPET